MFVKKIFKKNKGQQLIEFALVAPVLILVLLVIIEFGYALSVRNTLSSAAKSVLMKVNNKYNNLTGTAPVKKLQMESDIQQDIADYLDEHNVNNSSTVSVIINTDANGVSFIVVTYVYKLILPLIPGLPEIPLQTSQVINSAMIKENNFNSGLTTQQLSSFFPTPSSALTTGGKINSDNTTASGYAIRDNVALLVSWYDDYNVATYSGNIYARLFSWYGEDLLPPNLRINLRTATLEVRSPYYNAGDWLNTNIPYVWVVSALGYTQVFYTKYNSTVDVQYMGASWIGYTLNACNIGGHHWANLAYAWADDCILAWGQGDITSSWYLYLYRINPLFYNDTNHNDYNISYGYRWCGAPGMPACNADQSNFHTIQELALKGITRNSWKCSAHALDFHYNIDGNSDNTLNTGSTHVDYIQHYTARSSDYNNFDGNYAINIYQPVINNGSNYYTSGYNVDPAKMVSSSGPLFTVFKWDFKLIGGVLTAGAPNVDLVDVYIDSDGDGIPNAWDNEPTWFDRDGNGQLDGLQQSLGVNDNSELNYEDVCGTWPNPNPSANASKTYMNTAWTAYSFPVPGINQPIISTPFNNTGTGYPGTSTYLKDSKKTLGSLKSFIPQPTYADFKLLGGRLYLPSDDENNPTGIDDIDRRVYGWSSTASTELTQKERFIYGHICGSDICLGIPSNAYKSPELYYLENNNFSATNKITRTPVGW